MKKVIQLGFIVLLMIFTFSNCGKKSSGGGETPAPAEADLVVKLSPEPSSGINQTLSSTYTFNVVVESAMPPQGVEIKVDYVKDAGGASMFSQTLTSTVASTAVTINNIPFNEVGTVTVVVTSKSKSSNTVSKTFKLVRK